ncbi:MAG: glutamyl-tRNA reductase, partial [Verrucomicrobiota bacterium]
MSLLVLGLSHHQAPVAVRERFAVPEADIPSLTRHLKVQGVVDEVVVVSTCNRVELYAASPLPVDSAAAGLRNSLEHRGAADSSEVVAGWYRHEGRGVASHLFGVASGLDSM